MSDHTVECDGCGREVYGSNPDAEHYCPDCSDQARSHGTGYQREQAKAVWEMEHRQHVIANDRHRGRDL